MTDLLRILIAPLVWLASFSAIYGLHGLLCGHDIAGTAFGLPIPRVLLVSAFAVSILLQVVMLIAHYHPRFASPTGFIRFVSRATGWVGLVATVWSLLPVAMTSYCV